MTATELRIRRERLGLSQTELGRELGITQQAVSAWERGENAIPASIQKLLAFVEATYEAK
jgi:transcriptional regulator with XRE-family HTH domain